jgi:hypothetical protein
LLCATVARADLLEATGFAVGSQNVTLTSPAFVLGPTVNAGAFNLNPPAGIIAYCIDIFQTLTFGTLYNDYATSSLAADGGLTAARKGGISQLFHGFYDTSLTSSTNSAAFQLALWEIAFETDPGRNVDGANLADRGVTYATSPNTPANVITIADAWLAGLGSFSTDTAGITTYRSGVHQDLISYQHVPEPATWTLLVAGLGLLAFMAHRRMRA